MVNNVYDLVTRTMEQEFPGQVAFRWVEDATGTVKEKTYAEYVQDIRRAAAWFAQNIPEVEGKRVVLLSRNCYEYGVNTFGAVLAGAVLVTMNQKKTWDELSWELELAEPALILNDGVDYGCPAPIGAAVWGNIVFSSGRWGCPRPAVTSWRLRMGNACGRWMSGRTPRPAGWKRRSTPMP